MNHRNPAIKRILADVKELKQHPSSRYQASPLEENMFEWHFTIRGPPDSAFEGGVYHGRIILPSEYPFKPPNIVFLTKNGRFEVGTKICLSISAYHEESWQPAWGIRTMLEAIISFFPSEGAGAIGALEWTVEERKKLAVESLKYSCPLCGCAADLLSEPSVEEKPDAEIANQIAQLHMMQPLATPPKTPAAGTTVSLKSLPPETPPQAGSKGGGEVIPAVNRQVSFEDKSDVPEPVFKTVAATSSTDATSVPITTFAAGQETNRCGAAPAASADTTQDATISAPVISVTADINNAKFLDTAVKESASVVGEDNTNTGGTASAATADSHAHPTNHPPLRRGESIVYGGGIAREGDDDDARMAAVLQEEELAAAGVGILPGQTTGQVTGVLLALQQLPEGYDSVDKTLSVAISVMHLVLATIVIHFLYRVQNEYATS